MNNQDIEDAYKKYEPRLHDYAYSILHNHHDASDAVQSAFLDFAQSKCLKSDMRHLKGIVKHKAAAIQKTDEMYDTTYCMNGMVAPVKDQETNIYDLMEGLTALQEAVTLLYLQGMSIVDIGRIMGIGNVTVTSKLIESIKAIRKEITSQVDLLGI